MKFGSQLRDAIYPEWRSYYIDYDGLKKKLRKAEKDRPFTEKDETEFVEVLDNNLEKIYSFHQEKMEDITSRIDAWAERLESANELSEEEMGGIQESINEIADDVNHLARFSRLNYTGFLKIIKKHDRHTNYILRPMFMVRLNQCPFWKQDYAAILIKLSELFSKARQGGKRMSFKTPVLQSMESSDGTLKRTVVKRFFVHADNVLELKTYVLRHLPVLVYRDHDSTRDNIDPPVSSLYLDNASLDLYNGRVESAAGSQIVRLRWYGSAKNNASIALELRTLEDEENGAERTERFTIKDKYVDGYLKGDTTFIEKTAKKMRAANKSEEDVQKFEQLARKLQAFILQRQLQPVLRTYYKRTAFQIPGDNKVRMALDTDLCFIREDSKLFPDDPTVRRPDNNWRRPEADINFPFTELKPDSEVNRYPYATFEIKLDLLPGESEPDWILDLEESDILEEAHHFNKFVHGIAIMFDTRVALLPYWLAQIDEDVQQLPVLPSQTPSVAKKTHKGKGKAYPQPEAEPSPVDDTGDVRVTMDQDTRRRKSSSQASERSALLGNGGAISTSYRSIDQPSTSKTVVPESSRGSWKDKIEAMPRVIADAFSYWFARPQQPQPEPVVLPPGVKIPKKVVTPLRVEPKVFFANERTYFSWMSFGTLMATFSIALFNAGDAVGKISGVVYTLISLSTLLYGMGLYYRRRELIRAKMPGPYDDTTGPAVICFALLFAVGLNAYLKFTVKSPSVFYF